MKIRYYPIEHDANAEFDDAYECETDHDTEFDDWMAEDCADDYHSNHDGWESRWPITFRIWMESGEVLGDYHVEREYEPVFRAHRKE
jgi:hypothetical protein